MIFLVMVSRSKKLADDEALILIPSRMASQRLPGKPLELIGGVPMIVRVAQQAKKANLGKEVIVATDDKAIAEAVEKENFKAILTSASHESGSDRIYEALEKIDPEGKIKIVINLQGDLPEIDSSILRPLAESLMASDAAIATPVAPASAGEENQPQIVKAVIAFADEPAEVGSVGRVLYFSRSPIPSGGAFWHHIGIYAWKREALKRFVALPPSPLERSESLEQLRALEAGMEIIALVVDKPARGIDTPSDLIEANKRYEGKGK